MSNTKLLRKILRLIELKVTWFRFQDRGKELHLGVKPYKNGCLCPECGRRCRIVRYAVDERSWKDLAVFGLQVYFHYAPKEIECPTHGLLQEEIPWAHAYERVTYRLEFRVCALAKRMTQKAAAEIVGMPPSTFSDVLHRVIERVRRGHKIRGLVTVGVDEISYRKGRKFATIVYDLDRSEVIWVGKGKGRETIDRFFNEELSKDQKKRIEWASCDMAKAYTEAIKAHCPNATLVIDRFHVVKKLNEAVDEVRKEQWRSLGTEGRKAMKGLRWLLGMHSRNRTPQQTDLLSSMLKNANRRIQRAWVLKDEFEHFWNYRYKGAAERFLNRWMTAALRTRIPSMREFVGTLRNHFENILSFITRRLTNAVAEGLNRIMKIVKNRASGYANLHSFADMIFLTVGDVDIPAQIPSRLRTL